MSNQTVDIHHNEDRLKWNKKKFTNSEHVTQSNKEAVKRFIDKCYAEGLSDARVKKYITNFHTIFKLAQEGFEMKIRKYALKSDLYPQGITADNLTQEIPYAERIVPHSLRHTYATRLLRAGEPMAKVSRLLGHESVKTTVDIYGHLNIEDLRQTAEKVTLS